MEQRLETFILAAGLIIAVLFGVAFSLDSVAEWRTSFEGQDVSLVSYEAGNYDPTRGTALDLGGVTTTTIDPDGRLKYYDYGFRVEKGGGTGLHIALGVPAPVNYINGRYVQVGSQPEWRPSEQWDDVKIDGQPHSIAVYRMMAGISIATTTSRPEKGVDECDSIPNLKIDVKVNLPTWKKAEEVDVGLGMIYIPRAAEVEATIYDPPVLTEVIDYKQNRGIFGAFQDISYNLEPYIAPQTPGTLLYGIEVSKQTNIVGAPQWAIIRFEWASIMPGRQDIGFLKEQRTEVAEKVLFVMVFMASRPLYAAAAAGGPDLPVGGIPEPIQCELTQDPIYDLNGRIIACEDKDTGGLKQTIMILVIVVVGGIILILIIKWLLLGVLLRH